MEGGPIVGASLIEDYVRELRRTLRLPRRTRERVLAEVSDHLTTATEHGESEDAAIRAFGSPREVARRFSEELSVAQARRATWLTVVMTLVFSALIALDAPWRSSALGRVFGVLSVFTVQIALTCAALSLIRAVRHRRDRSLPAGKLRWILRGDAVALGCVVLTAATGLAAVLFSAHPADHTGVLIRSAATIVLALPPLAALARGRSRARGLAAFADTPPLPGDDALADVTALFGPGRRWAEAFRTHPWRGALVTAALAGAALGFAHAVSEGGPPTLAELPRAAAAFALLLVIEGSAIIVCFAALGWLSRHPPTPPRRPRLNATPR